MGYSLRRGRRGLIVGSTYEHNFENLNTTQEAWEQIHNKLAAMLPAITQKAVKKYQMAGARVTTPNKLPVIGRHYQIKNLCIYTAMGSKGLLFSEYVASLLANHPVEQKDIPAELDTKRFSSN